MIRSTGMLMLTAMALPLAGQAPAPTVRFGAFADAYYAWDAGRPALRDRAFTTQSVRHDEFNINLAHIEASLAGERVRGRLALQAGTAVQANYAGEPAIGTQSGPSLARSIQEAVVGVRVRPSLWVDGGVFFSHVGQESWISRDNPTYTRSFTAEYTPYYSSGMKVTWAASPEVTAQVHLLNGWQNISENNERKALGARIDWMPRAGITLGWAGFRGDEQPEASPRRMRDVHQLFARLEPRSDLTLWLTADRGWERPESGSTATWGSLTGIAERRLSPTVSLAARVERYADRDGVLIPVADPRGFAVTSTSLGLNLRLPDGVQWRTEARGYWSDGAVWPDRQGTQRTTAALVTSLSLTFAASP
jgi:hypothetical protein